MINIGIDKNTNLVYEVNCGIGRRVWPTPVITPAKFVFLSQEEPKALSSNDPFGYRFREDSYDPITRVRRGRFYKDMRRESILAQGIFEENVHAERRDMDVFYGNPIYHQWVERKAELPVVLLGVDDRFTSWAIIDVEAIATGEDLVTLKARSSFGLLPVMSESKIPQLFRAKLNEALDTFADEIHRSAPASVIDRARDVVVHALLAFYDLQKLDALDLGKLIKRLEADGRVVAENSANIIARLHARAKPSEQEKHALRPIREQDADLAVQCVGALLCEIGFAEWA